MFARDPEKMESFLGADSNFKGELNVIGALRVEGISAPRSWWRSNPRERS